MKAHWFKRVFGSAAVVHQAALLFTIALILTACGKAAPEVVSNGETLRGEWDDEPAAVAVFRGIPFAAPPVGDLRWRAPQTHTARSGNVAAVEFAPACPQGDYMIDWYAKLAAAFGHGPEVVQRPNSESEDCLYLNVWTPNLQPESPLPVMVYVHGGANQGGWSYEPNYLGAQLAARGVVVVTIAYRLGPLGFFSHPALGNGEDEVVANFGLLDIAAAFSWVRANISSFGGAADNITGFGESAGAGNLIDLALATDYATNPDKGPLFERIISQSSGGSLDKRRTLSQEQQLGQKLVTSLGLDESVTAAQLRGLSPEELIKAGKNALPEHYFDAVIDGRTMLQQPVNGLIGPQATRLNILIGSNRDEWLMYLDPDTDAPVLKKWIMDTTPEFLGTLSETVADAPDSRHGLDRLITAKRMLCPGRLIAEKASSAGGEGLVYWFTRRREGQGGETLGVYHGAELPYVFNTHDDWLATAAADATLTDAMMSYWVAFASTGSVRTPGLPEWPMYTGSRPWVMELGDNLGVVEPPDAWLCNYLSPQLPLPGDLLTRTAGSHGQEDR